MWLRAVLVDGTANDVHQAAKYHVGLDGHGRLRDLLAERLAVSEDAPSPPAPLTQAEGRNAAPLTQAEGSKALLVFCQDSLDYEAARRQNRLCRETGTPWIWASCGALSRAYVSPLFLPDAGPCFGCLLQSFQRLSPAPEIYAALSEQAKAGRPIASVEFPYEGLIILQGLVQWKLGQAELEHADPALYRLHVLECAHFEVTTHRVFADPLCPECGPT